MERLVENGLLDVVVDGGGGGPSAADESDESDDAEDDAGSGSEGDAGGFTRCKNRLHPDGHHDEGARLLVRDDQSPGTSATMKLNDVISGLRVPDVHTNEHGPGCFFPLPELVQHCEGDTNAHERSRHGRVFHRTACSSSTTNRGSCGLTFPPNRRATVGGANALALGCLLWVVGHGDDGDDGDDLDGDDGDDLDGDGAHPRGEERPCGAATLLLDRGPTSGPSTTAARRHLTLPTTAATRQSLAPR